MNRAASFLWATTVALVLSVPAFAENKVVRFPAPVKMSASGSKSSGSAETVDVPTQIIRNRAANRQAVVRPRAGARIPRNVTKINYKKAVKFSPAKAIAGVVISGAIGAVGWIMSDGVLVKKIKDGDPISPDFHGWVAASGSWCGDQKFTSPSAAQSCVKSALTSYLGSSYLVASDGVTYLGANYYKLEMKVTYLPNGNVNTGSYDTTITRQGSCPSPYILVNDTCITNSPEYAPLTDADYDQLVGSVDTMDPSQLGALFDELALVDPSFGMLMPEYLRSASGATAEQLATNPLITNIARLNPDGSVSRLTKTEQSTFDITYPETGNTFNYKVTNKTTITNEAGEKVEEQTEVEEGAEEAPELSTSLESANDPLKDWATSLADVPASATPGISYPLLFTYGGTCSLSPVSLPYFGTYGLDPICQAINDYVKPILGILFAAWTILHIFGVWRETTMHVRPA